MEKWRVLKHGVFYTFRANIQDFDGSSTYISEKVWQKMKVSVEIFLKLSELMEIV